MPHTIKADAIAVETIMLAGIREGIKTTHEFIREHPEELGAVEDLKALIRVFRMYTLPYEQEWLEQYES